MEATCAFESQQMSKTEDLKRSSLESDNTSRFRRTRSQNCLRYCLPLQPKIIRETTTPSCNEHRSTGTP